MMMNKRLIRAAGNAKRHVGMTVLFQWLGLCANVVLVLCVTRFFVMAHDGALTGDIGYILAGVMLLCVGARLLASLAASKMSFRAGEKVKTILRSRIYQKLLRLGSGYNTHVSTSEMVQLCGEGVEQLEIYFGRYLPQFFYSLLAPLTLFAVLAFFSLKAALVLLICVPLIPLSIVMMQKFAKKLLAKYGK